MPMKYSLLLNQDILIELGKRLKDYRLNSNLSIKELSVKSGISVRTIGGFERGEKNISLINLIEIIRVFGLVDNLNDLIPKMPTISPIELMKIEEKRKKRIKK